MSTYNSGRMLENDAPQLPAPPPVEGARGSTFQMIWHRRWMVAIAALVGLIGGYIRYRVATPIYTTKAQVMVTRSGPPMPGNNFDTSSDTHLYTQKDIIGSPTVLSDAATKLQENPATADFKSIDWNDPIPLLQLNTHVTVDKLRDQELFVEYETPYKDEAKAVLSAILKAYLDHNTQSAHTRNTDTAEKWREGKDLLQKDVNAKHDEQVKFLRENGLVNFESDKGNLMVQRLAALGDSLSAAHRQTLISKTDFEEKARAAISDPKILQALIDTGQFRGVTLNVGSSDEQLRQDMDAAQHLLAVQKQRYLPQYPAVRAAQETVDQLNATYVLFLHQRWVDAAQLELVFQTDYDNATKEARDMTIKAAQYAKLQADLDNTQRLMDGLDTRIKEASVDPDAGQVNLEVLAWPTPPEKTKPIESVVLFEGLLIGLILGVAITFIDTRLRSVEEVSAAVGMPILSVIPHMARRQTPATRGRKVHLEPMSDVAEAFRGLRSAVLFGPRAKTVLVTSALRGEGKSTCAANLAIALAESGHHVLLVDADLREPTQHKIFATGEGVGLSGVVAGRTSAEKAINSTTIKGLDLLACGQIPFNPSETINNQAFADLLVQLGTRYDYLVIDSPPVMPVTDARILGAMCDLTVLVVRAEVTGRRAAADARDGLLGFGANLLGVVVNDGPRKRSRYGYYGGYGLHRRTVASAAHVGATQQGNGEHVLAGQDLIVSNNRR
jgi:capsular exopolysaccharide synthesis family protein